MTELMQMVIDKLGVKVGERFKLRDMNNHISPSKYYFNVVGKLDSPEDVHKYNLQSFFIGLFTGEYRIVKIPFKPNRLQNYWCIDFNNFSFKISLKRWYDFADDYINYYIGNCFRTQEEITEEDKKRIVAEMKSKYETE